VNDERIDDPDDEFRAAVTDVRPLPSRDRAAPDAPKPPPVARFKHADEASVLEESLHGPLDPAGIETGEELVFRQAGVQLGVMRKLRRGAYAVEAELDLHGMTVPVARLALDEFLKACINSGRRCVRLVHGKGQRSGQRGPVLKNKVNVWLRRRSEVLAFASTPPLDGGTGAIYILLARPRHSP
jgi:DNA-nicking Smr family endonuclease